MLLANNVGPDQTSHDVAFDLGLHCLLMTLLRISRQAWIKLLCFELLSFIALCLNFVVLLQ